MNCASLLRMALLFGSVGMSSAQELSTTTSGESQHLLTGSSGISTHTVRDEMMSPLLYRGTQVPLTLSYRFRGSENRHTLLLSYENTELHSSITRTVNDAAVTHYINNLHLNCEYSFSTRAAVWENLNTTFFLGARLSGILNLRNHYFHNKNKLMSAEQMTGLGIHLLTETALQHDSENYLRVEINIPCVSYVLLSDRYNANVSEDFDNIDVDESLLWQLFKRGHIVSFDKLFEMQADVSYIFFVGNHIGFDLQYRLLYYSFAQYKDVLHAQVLNNHFLLGITVNL